MDTGRAQPDGGTKNSGVATDGSNSPDVSGASGASDSSDGRAAADAMLGRTLGSYRIVRKIAQGGMGAVYEAVHATLGRRAAVKVMLNRLRGHPDAARRFFTEAKAISMVTHPCLVTIYEHGTAEGPNGDDQAYIVMEFLEGESLRARADKAYLGGSAVELVRQLASALAATHKKRIIHRDLKPDNIMLVRDDTVPGGVRAKLLDFGIAKVLPGDEGDDEADEPGGKAGEQAASEGLLARRSVKTRTGALIGTPTYMSPEQCRAATMPDGKTDVYSLGVIFYELLYGEPPFVSDSAGEMYALHMFAPPPDLKKRVPALSPQLGDLVTRLLAKKPAERPSMEELLTQLAEIPRSGLSDGPLESRPSASLSKAAAEDDGSTSSFMRRHFVVSNPTNTTTGASSGEQVAPRPVPAPRSKGRVLLAGGALLGALALGGVAVVGLRKPPARVVTPPPPATVQAAPAPPEPPRPAPPDGGLAETAAATERAGTTPPASPTATSARGRAPEAKTSTSRKEKPSRKSPHAAKREKYDIDLWK